VHRDDVSDGARGIDLAIDRGWELVPRCKCSRMPSSHRHSIPVEVEGSLCPSLRLTQVLCPDEICGSSLLRDGHLGCACEYQAPLRQKRCYEVELVAYLDGDDTSRAV
jgi:hypothetical protein